jgi:hypothetical protein
MDATDALVDVTTVDGPDLNVNVAPDGLRAFVGAGGYEADDGEASLEALEAELPVVHDEQVPLGDLVSRVVQALYAELSELAETCVITPCTRCCFLTFLRLLLPHLRIRNVLCSIYSMPSMSDPARKRTLADWVVKSKKQVVKLYAIAKWARDADAVQKCMVRVLFPHSSSCVGPAMLEPNSPLFSSNRVPIMCGRCQRDVHRTSRPSS